MARMFNRTIVNDFHIHEQGYGTQGAPFVAFVDGLVLHHPTALRTCRNADNIDRV